MIDTAVVLLVVVRPAAVGRPRDHPRRDLLLIVGYKLVVPRGYEFEVSRLGKIATWGLYASIGVVLVTEQGTPSGRSCVFWISLALAVVAAGQYVAQGAARGRRASGAQAALATTGRRGARAKSPTAKPQAEVDPFATLHCFESLDAPDPKGTRGNVPDLLPLSDDELSTAARASSRRRRTRSRAAAACCTAGSTSSAPSARSASRRRSRRELRADAAPMASRAPALRGHRRPARRARARAAARPREHLDDDALGRDPASSSRRRTTSRSTGG